MERHILRGAERWRQSVAKKDKHICPVCGQYEFKEFNSYKFCPICDWQDDAVLEADPDYAGGAFGKSLNQERAEWKAKQKE